MKFMRKYSSNVELNLGKRFLLTTIGFLGYATKLIRHRGFYTYTKIITRLLPTEDNVLTINLFNNRFIKFNIGDYYWLRLISLFFEYEPEIKMYLNYINRQKFLFVDLGANVGYWSLYCSQLTNCEKIIALEPHPTVFKNLESNLTNIPMQISLINSALSDSQTEYVRFHSPIDFDNLVGSSISMGESTNESSYLVKIFIIKILLPNIYRQIQMII